jgi:hypothetical protein
VSTKEIATNGASRKRSDVLRHVRLRQISQRNSGSPRGDSDTGGSQSTTSTSAKLPSSKPKKEERRGSQSSVGSQSTLSTKPSMSRRQQQIVQMIRTKSATRRMPLAAQPKLRSTRSYSASVRPPIYPVPSPIPQESSKTISDNHRTRTSSEITEKPRTQPDPLYSEALKRHFPRSSSSPQPSTRVLQPQIRTVFHVRLSIGYMTGLAVERVAKWTRNSNHNLVVGFVELASSGKYTALSQPLLPIFGGGKSETTKILWANPNGNETSKSRRRLHFSLQLDRKQRDSVAPDDEGPDDENFSLGSRVSYVPEVVKLLVGLKCGDERLPLGVASFVVNGSRAVQEKMDIPLHPEPSLASPAKVKRGIFGKKQQQSSFTHGDHVYNLAPNAKLRVKADIKTGLPGQDGASVWASGFDDSSYSTNWTFETEAAPTSAPPKNLHQGIDNTMMSAPAQLGSVASTSREPANDVETGNLSPRPTNPESLRNYSKSMGKKLIDTSTGQPSFVQEAPIQFVSLRSPTDVMSFMSGLTAPEPCDGSWFTKSCLPFFCGDDTETPRGRRRLVAKSFSFESSEKSGMTGTLRNSGSESTSSSSDDSSIVTGEDLQGTLIQINKDLRSKSSGLGDPHETADDEVETLDVTVETYNDLKKARETLMRYAIRVGVDMGDLLDGKQNVRRQ